jgi:hypothetical protein
VIGFCAGIARTRRQSRIEVRNDMRLRAYVLAADPAWLETSIQSYYDVVEKIVVSYDRNKVGWTGYPIPVDECLDRARSIDKDKKMEFVPGDFAILSNTPMENDTRQRAHALASVGDADWVLQLDTDEIVVDVACLLDQLARLPKPVASLVWPMRSFYQQTVDGRYLEVCSRTLHDQIDEYFPVAVRPGSTLISARMTKEEAVTLHSRGLSPKSWFGRPTPIRREQTMLHFSWVRSNEQMLRKLRSWSHAKDFDTEHYYREIWSRAPTEWKTLHDFHPLTPPKWPALRPVELPYAANW